MSEIEREVEDLWEEHARHTSEDREILKCSSCASQLDFSQARDIHEENDEAVENYEPRNPLE